MIELKLSEIVSGIPVASLLIYIDISRRKPFFQTQENIFKEKLIIVEYKMVKSKPRYFFHDLNWKDLRVFVQRFHTGCLDTRFSYMHSIYDIAR